MWEVTSRVKDDVSIVLSLPVFMFLDDLMFFVTRCFLFFDDVVISFFFANGCLLDSDDYWKSFSRSSLVFFRIIS